LALLPAVLAAGPALARPAFEAGDGADVSAYLPEAAEPGFVTYRPGPTKTPALRSGTIDPKAPYVFSLPKGGKWKEQPVANAVSGNYCQPRCDEPTTECIFASPKQGKVKVIISPLTKVTRLVNPSVSDVGTPEELATGFGPAITGDSFDAADDLVSSSSATVDGQSYYYYEMAGPHIAGDHLVASLTFKGGVSVLLVAAATDKQWAAAEGDLRKIVASFRMGVNAA